MNESLTNTLLPYFSEHYPDLSYPIVSEAKSGLYNAQVGAVHALAAHFTVSDQAAIVTMPTGSGKTAVLMMLPFITRSNRVLIITPSRLVRGQIADDFKTLQTLRDIGVLPATTASPRVLELEDRIASAEDWEKLRQYDVVVSTPNCTSPAYEGTPVPPGDLFDLVVIDEAHHTPASTWASLLTTLKHTNRALFSATPFRRDRGEIPGRFVYNYPLARAFQDRIFGRISYIRVDPQDGVNGDVLVARRTDEIFAADRQNGLTHCVMVRTDRKKRAEELLKIYEANTRLRLRVVHSGLSNRTVKKVLSALENEELDGVICVNMMGEGFNFPRLKIAAVHTPHKSLEVTLQFIGRFARTNAQNIGEAKFVAMLSDIEIERRRIFDEGAIWQDIIPELSYGRIAGEIHTREVLEDFHDPTTGDPDLTDLSLYSLYPRTHVKIYDVQDDVDLRNVDIEFHGSQTICYRSSNDDGTVLILITCITGSPKWSMGDAIANRAYDLIVVFHDRNTKLLFVNSSKSVNGTYESIATAVSDNAHPLATGQVGKVVKEVKNKRIFNVGMRNIQAANTRESYKILAASDAQIDPADARRYRQGHVFLSGEEAGQRMTIGYSSGAKVWSSTNIQIPQLLEWCAALGRKIRSAGPVVTNSGLDYLDAGQVVEEIPAHLIYVQWGRAAFDFNTPVQVEYTKTDGTSFRGHILDLDLSIQNNESDAHHIRVLVSGDGIEQSVSFSLEDFYTPIGATGDEITVIRGNHSVGLLDYLNECNLDFYTADASLFSGNELFESKQNARPIRPEQIVVWQWDDTNIEKEVISEGGRLSIHEKLSNSLQNGPSPIILYDHGKGEIADYITIDEVDDTTVFALYHCKGSGGATPGARVDDVFEVCGQAQKSVAFSSLVRLEKRLRDRRGLQFVRGDRNVLRDVLGRAKDRRQKFEIKIVQPGIGKAGISDAMAECLGATSSHLVGVGISPLEVIASA